MENVDATYPMELVHMDFLTIEATKGGRDVHILVITDYFTRYAQPTITSLQTAKCTAQNFLGYIHSTLWSSRKNPSKSKA